MGSHEIPLIAFVLLSVLNSSAFSLLVTILLTIWCIKKGNWYAPPILTVAIIPYFMQSSDSWLIPISVGVSLLGVLAVIDVVEKRLGHETTSLR
ncbi:uncharacterized membrane protein YgaE (UPF0421/DUF939 family) [Paenibacillus sp. PvR052]|nr:uncharacterized membrane protein YgaE (UPF0421/DUF939 family) [Paenibacillus sp. PvP091]MBP1170883.1 uncharacterized membrane protein YgaE (UPF0421/DUF939 family) [Paenibacillus sp. PvR098]MBP2441911.1 uncharacterized membrane protein YgaE (UPF0421/DUF939 family) [Paenibacillus sp. PvP052]